MSARTMALDALKSLVEIIDKAGLSNLTNGVQMGQTSWYVKASDRLEAARAAIAALEAKVAQEVEPVMFGIRSVRDGSFFNEVAVVGWGAFPQELAKLKSDNWVLAERAEVVPLFTAPQAVNAAMFQALQDIASGTYDRWTEGYRAQQIAIAAIKKAEGAKL